MQAEIEELIEIIEANTANYDALMEKIGEPIMSTLEGKANQAIALAKRDPRFHEMFLQIEGSKGFDFLNMFVKIGQAFGKVGAAIKTAIDKKKAAKAAATAKAAQPKVAAPPPPPKTNPMIMIGGVVFGLLIIIGGLYLIFSEPAPTKTA
jgi:hypothetical protein